MASSRQKNKQVFDEVRNLWVAATPEEIVRQKVLQTLLKVLEFPKGLIAVERELHTLVPFQSRDLPERRADILCFAKAIDHPDLLPLLLIECKSGRISRDAIDQVLGYNHFVRARFAAVADETGIYLLTQDREPALCPLPSFPTLLKSLAFKASHP
jgi:hypothetical protein